MDLITDRINSFMQLEQPTYKAISEQKADDNMSLATQNQGQQLLPDVVSISTEGEKMHASEKEESSLWQDLHKLSTNQQELFETEQSTAEQSAIDAAIERLEKQIRELKERMDELIGKEDEASQKQLEQLETELIALTTQLMEFHNKKLEQLKNM